MSTIRGRTSRTGGMVTDAGATARTTAAPTGADVLVRPAFRVAAQVVKPSVPASFTGWLDPNSITFWRLVVAGLAVGYIMGWHLKLGGLRIRL